MSDTNVIENAGDIENPVDDLEIEGLADVESLGNDEAELDHEGNPIPSEEIDLESTVSVDDILGSHPDEEEKKRNQAFARMRVEKKKLEEEREALIANGIPAPTGRKPRRVDFLDPEVVLDRFQGDVDLAKAAYEDAIEDFSSKGSRRINERRAQIEAEIKTRNEFLDIEEQFQEKSKAVKNVKNFENNIAIAEAAMAIDDGKGGYIDGSLVIKKFYPDDAPMMLAALGLNPKIARKLVELPDQASIFKALADLQMKCKKVAVGSQKVSQAARETPVTGAATTGALTDIEKKMNACAKKGDVKGFQKYKALLRK